MESEKQSSTPGAEDQDLRYALNRSSYETHYRPTYERMGILPRYLVQFPVVLPFHIPFRQGSCYSFELSDQLACTLQFGVISSQENIQAGITGPSAATMTVHRTRVEMTYVVTADEPPQSTTDALSVTFDLLVSKLNAIIAAYLVATKDYRVHAVTKEMFQWGSLYRIIPTANWMDFQVGLFLLHAEVPYEAPELSEETTERIAHLAWAIGKDVNPFLLSEQLALSGRRNLAYGNYREAVIEMQTSVETFLSVLLTELLRKDGWDKSAIDAHFASTGFATRLRRDFHSRLGGKWSTVEIGTPIGEWYERTYLMRNRIIHGGYRPTLDEANEALAAALDLRVYVVGLLSERRQEYQALLDLLSSPEQPAV